MRNPAAVKWESRIRKTGKNLSESGKKQEAIKAQLNRDLVFERDDGQVIALEIKAGTRVSGEDLRGLRLLKDRLGPRLQEAVILYSGQYAYRHEDWAWILPLSQLWT